ncbi:Lipoprotein signal peptidase [Candidatus Gullanella endobia]|uniref:Lipoprotein signal peptidase n=1 Tax=Candidatus Gullanella endobia TaxID=1070130 RepID=A0A143WQU1_9ENTR|nr:signal peptidase II [Candidatus Gullanella endobia]CUX96102.1 Lipoprotein signal peptidase [Candidatus Gullanella endobia]
MNKIIKSTGLYWFWVSLLVLVLDLGSKEWIMTYFCLGESVSVVQFINFTYTHNPGAAFSFLANREGWQRWVLSVISIVIILILLVIMYYSDKQVRLFNIACAIIIGGALGNLFNRIIYSVVIDFIDFHVGNWCWPTFNIADAGICVGSILIILEYFYCSHVKIIKTERTK